VIFLADEGIDSSIVAKLRADGYQVLYVAEMAPGIPDEAVLEQANEQQALLLTSDKDFGELVFRLGRLHTGVVLVRLAGLSADSKATIVAETVARHGAKLLNAFTVISPAAIRIRTKLPG
jgi:predicted nuclease of predicted toxin-antitoxin system